MEDVRKLIREILQNGWFELTKDDMSSMIDKRRANKRFNFHIDNTEWNLDRLLQNMSGDEILSVKDPQTGKVHEFSWKDIAHLDIQNVENTINNELHSIKKVIGDFYYDKENLIISIFSQEEFDDKNLYPFPIYISKTNDQYDGIGVMTLGKGKYEMFEENEEASTETYAAVNTLLGLNNKWSRIYASHNSDLVQKIKSENKLPKDLYVSPDIDVARGYWSTEEQRVLFTAMVNMSDIRMESHIDWKTANEAPIKKMSILTNI